MPILRKDPILKGKTQFWRRTTGRKSNMCEEKQHARQTTCKARMQENLMMIGLGFL
jgi:hypothetical protein